MVTFVELEPSVLSVMMGQFASVLMDLWETHFQEVSVYQMCVLEIFHVQNLACA